MGSRRGQERRRDLSVLVYKLGGSLGRKRHLAHTEDRNNTKGTQEGLGGSVVSRV